VLPIPESEDFTHASQSGHQGNLMKKNCFAVLCTVVMFALGAPAQAGASSSELLPVQGYLTDDSEQPLSGVYKLNFAMFTSSTGGSSLYESEETVSVERGRFSAYLGESAQLPLEALNTAKELWLEVIITRSCTDLNCSDSHTINKVLSPRIQLGTALWANTANYCKQADDAKSIGGVAVGNLQAKLTDRTCPSGQGIVGFSGGSPVCGTIGATATATPTTVATTTAIADTTCPTGQGVVGFNNGSPVCGALTNSSAQSTPQAAAIDYAALDARYVRAPGGLEQVRIDGNTEKGQAGQVTSNQAHQFCALTRIDAYTRDAAAGAFGCRIDPVDSKLPSKWTLSFSRGIGICVAYCW
jgi:hypothetical protein